MAEFEKPLAIVIEAAVPAHAMQKRRPDALHKFVIHRQATLRHTAAIDSIAHRGDFAACLSPN